MVYDHDRDDILSFEPAIWSTCDILRGAGIKQSEFPNFMMPFFALLMVESRIKRQVQKYIEEDQLDQSEILEQIQDDDFGYNTYLIEHNRSLKEICENDSSFLVDLERYLNAFDDETRKLLGVEATGGEKYMDIKGYIETLKAKKVLFEFCQAWSVIDLTPYSNSDITTLEEHIKRRWADISASTAGEHYTPDDVIALISETFTAYLEAEKKDTQEPDYISLYDLTCGGGNMLFGVADHLEERFPYTEGYHIGTYGQEINDSLYALAKIESRFRNDSYIAKGNTLIDDRFADIEGFDLIAGNPPYGVDWKSNKKDVLNDKTGRYVDYPSTSDGQLLFVQHSIAKLNETGKAMIVLNGSPLFSGDAGSGESNIRQWILENDYLEALIQLPTNEFFNTGITTYIWLLNKAKRPEQQGKITLIDASNLFTKLKKSKGNKTKELAKEARSRIVSTLLTPDAYADDEQFVKVCDRYDFFYNKQALQLNEVSVKGETVLDIMPRHAKTDVPAKSMMLGVERTFPGQDKAFADQLNLEYKEQDPATVSFTDPVTGTVWRFDETLRSIVTQEGSDAPVEYGYGELTRKAVHRKATKNREECVEVQIILSPVTQKDHEIVEYSPNPDENAKLIQAHMDRWVTKPYELGENRVGVEINFNKLFYVPETLRPLNEIQDELKESFKRLNTLMNDIFN